MLLQVFLSCNVKENIDVYRLKIGVRSLHWSNKEFLINGKPIYFRGFGRHEDSDVSYSFIQTILLVFESQDRNFFHLKLKFFFVFIFKLFVRFAAKVLTWHC